MRRAVRAGSCAFLAALLSACVSQPARAGELKLVIHDGHVTLTARDVSIRQILAEWARVGQTTIVDGDKLAGTPVSLTLENVLEGPALATLLRSASGYVAAPRRTRAPGVSRFDRIMILASSRTVPAAPIGGPASPAARSPVRRLAQPRRDNLSNGPLNGAIGARQAVPPSALPGALAPVNPVSGQPAGAIYNPLRQALTPEATPRRQAPVYQYRGPQFVRPTEDPQTAPSPGILINPPPSTPPGFSQS